MNYFTFDGKNSTEWGIGLSGSGVWDAPARKGESIYIPARNGAIWVDDESYENILLTYPCWMNDGFSGKIDDFRNYMAARSDKYYRLEDTYHPGFYRLARFAGEFIAEPGTRNITGRFDVNFDCDPRRISKTPGEEVIEMAGETVTITNPFRTTTWPLFGLEWSIRSGSDPMLIIEINGEAVVEIDGQGSTWVDFDLDTKRCLMSRDGVPYFNEKIKINQTNGFVSGDNTIKVTDTSGGDIYLSVRSEWWTI